MPVERDGNKIYIPGARKVTWDSGEMSEFAASFTSAVQVLGKPIDYPFVMGVSGTAFRFTFNPAEWDFSNYSVRSIAVDPYEPIRRSFDAVGYHYELWEKGEAEEDKARITQSLARGVPVLAFGVVGPSDCVVITGYDENGDVLLGWSTFQDIKEDHDFPPDETGYFCKPGWHENLGGYILIGKKKQQQEDLFCMYLDAFKWAVHLVREPRMVTETGLRYKGLNGMRAWAEQMTDERYFPQGDSDALSFRYLITTLNITMLRDHLSAEPFLRQAAVDVPEFAPELNEAAAEYAQLTPLRQKLDSIINDRFTPEALQAIADPERRRAFAEVILETAEQEDKAIAPVARLVKECC